MRNPRALVGAVALAVALAACGSTPDPASKQDPGPGGPGLEQVALARSTAAPFDLVTVSGLPDDLDGLELRTGDGRLVPVYLASGKAEISVPLHARDPWNGGTETLTFQQGSRTRTVDLEVRGLPRAAGAWQELVDRLTSLAEEAEKLAPGHPATAALRARVGAARAVAARYEDTALLDAITGSLDLSATVPTAAAWLEAGPGPAVGATSAGPDPAASLSRGRVVGATVSTALDARGTVRPATAVPSAEGACIDGAVKVTTIAELSAKMRTGADWAIREGGAEDRALKAIGNATSAAGFLPDVGWVAGVVGAMFAGIRGFKNAVSGRYPTQLDSITAQLDTSPFLEDFRSPRSWGPVTVAASSRGWDALDDVAAFTLALTGAGGSAVAGTAKNLTRAEEFATNLALFVREAVGNEFFSQIPSAGICPKKWEIRSNGAPYTRARSDKGLLDLDQKRQQVAPDDVQEPPYTDTLRIEVDPDLFAQQSASVAFGVSVKAIDVRPPSESVYVERPGEMVDIAFAVNDAHNKQLFWEAAHGGWKGTPRTAGELRVHTHVSSTVAKQYPYTVKGISGASTGLRADGEPPRVGVVTVRLRALKVLPDPGTTPVDRKLEMVAVDPDGKPVEVRWTVKSGGSIRATGKGKADFSAKEPGTYTVVATSVADAEVIAEAKVKVTDPACSFTFAVDGYRVTSEKGALPRDGASIIYNLTEAGALSRIHLFAANQSADAYLSGAARGTAAAGGPGTYRFQSAILRTLPGTEPNYGSIPLRGHEVVLDVFDPPRRISGSARGSVRSLAPNQGTLTEYPFTMTFSIEDARQVAGAWTCFVK